MDNRGPLVITMYRSFRRMQNEKTNFCQYNQGNELNRVNITNTLF